MHDLDDTKALKVTLPLDQHLTLHKLKILSGATISSIVEVAVEDYLERLDDDAARTVAERAAST